MLWSTFASTVKKNGLENHVKASAFVRLLQTGTDYVVTESDPARSYYGLKRATGRNKLSISLSKRVFSDLVCVLDYLVVVFFFVFFLTFQFVVFFRRAPAAPGRGRRGDCG